jgi:threonine dehydrogenase-like Zn-dependent dehydrogenase
MRALWLEDQRVTYRSDIPIPVPAKGQALVQVLLAGVCSTDLELMHGYYPFCGIPGHEFVGVVSEAPGEDDRVGKRVVGDINIRCGACRYCLTGRSNHCEKRLTLGIKGWNGVFAEYSILPVENLYVIPDEITNEAAVFTEPLAAACEILEQVPIRPADQWLVVGAGRLGLLVAQVLACQGVELSVVARHHYQRELLEQYHIPWLGENQVVSGQADVVVDTTGVAEGLSLARKAVRPRGVMVLKSTYRGDTLFNFSSVVVDEITLIGSRCGPFKKALQLLQTGLVDPRGLIQARYPVESGLLALEHAALPGALKILINLSEPVQTDSAEEPS